jgi:hypothetical protein
VMDTPGKIKLCPRTVLIHYKDKEYFLVVGNRKIQELNTVKAPLVMVGMFWCVDWVGRGSNSVLKQGRQRRSRLARQFILK